MRIATKKLIRAGIGILLAASIAYFSLREPPIAVETGRVRRGPFIETVGSDGVLRSRERYTVTAFANGEIDRVPLRVGDELKRGELITRLLWDVNKEPVRAPITGVVSKVYRESAGPIARGEPILELVDPRELEGVAEVLTLDASRIHVGDAAVISSPGLSEPIPAKVQRISRAGFVKITALGVEEERTEVTLRLVSPVVSGISKLGNTYHIDVAIEIGRTPGALIVPVGALLRDGSDWAVFRIEGARAKKARVRVLALSGGSARLGEPSPLREQDPVILYPGDRVKEGVRVKSEEAHPHSE